MKSNSAYDLAMQATETIRAAHDELVSELKGLEGKNAANEKRMLLLAAMPLKPEEVCALIEQQIDQAGARFSELAGWPALMRAYASPGGARMPLQIPVSLDSSARSPYLGAINLLDFCALNGPGAAARFSLDKLATNGAFSLFGEAADIGKSGQGRDLENSRLCYFFGDIIKERVVEYFRRHAQSKLESYPTDASEADKAMTAAARLAELEKRSATRDEIAAAMRNNDEKMVSLPIKTPERKNAAVRMQLPLEDH